MGPLTAGWQSRIRLATRWRRCAGGGWRRGHQPGRGAHFDEVIFACHSDQALALLADASEGEAILGAMPYQANDVWLHTDASCLPMRRKGVGELELPAR